jgi:uncharacterized protein YraI
MKRLGLTMLCALAVSATPAVADRVGNDSGVSVAMRAGPGPGHPMTARLGPGQTAERGACTAGRTWCLLSTDASYGWVAMRDLAPPDAVPVGPIAPVPGISMTRLPPVAAPPEPLPPSVREAVRRLDAIPPGARPPRMTSVTEPLRNVTDGAVNLRAGPGTDAAIVGRLEPGQGGLIDLCDRAERWCRIAPAGGPRGWVRMDLVGLRRLGGTAAVRPAPGVDRDALRT